MKDPHSDIILYIRNQYNTLTNSQKKIADYILIHSTSIVDQTTADIASGADVSEASVVRFCRMLGFKGFKEMKIKFAGSIGIQNTAAVPSVIEKGDAPVDVINKVMRLEYEDIKFCMEMMDQTVLLDVIELIDKSDRLAFFGVGSSAIVAENAKEHFLHYSKTAQAESETFAQITLASSLRENDLAFAISISGNSLVPIQAIEIAKKRGAKTVCITQNPHSHLARICDKVIVSFRKSQDLDDLGTATRLVPVAIIDAIAVTYATSNWEYTSAIAKENRTYFSSQRLNPTITSE